MRKTRHMKRRQMKTVQHRGYTLRVYKDYAGYTVEVGYKGGVHLIERFHGTTAKGTVDRAKHAIDGAL